MDLGVKTYLNDNKPIAHATIPTPGVDDLTNQVMIISEA